MCKISSHQTREHANIRMPESDYADISNLPIMMIKKISSLELLSINNKKQKGIIGYRWEEGMNKINLYFALILIIYFC